MAENATGADTVSALATFEAAVVEAATVSEVVSAVAVFASNIAETVTGADSIVGGNGADTLTGGIGNDLFNYANTGQSGVVATGVVDRITDFATTVDDISGLGVAGGALNEFTAVAGTSGNSYAQALAAANVVFFAANPQSYFMTSFGTDGASAQGILFLNIDNDATADGSILSGLSNQTANMAAATALLVAGDIIV